MKFNTIFQSIIAKQALNTQFHYTRLEDITNAIEMQNKIADFYLAKLEKNEILTPEEKKILAGTIIRSQNALKAAQSTMNYASIGTMPEFKAKFEEIKSDVQQIEAKVKGKVDQSFFELAKTAQFKPQKAGVQTINAEINPAGTDLDQLDKTADNYEMQNFSCDQVKQMLSTKYMRKFNTIKSFLNLRFAELKRANKKANPNVVNITLDFDSFCDSNPTTIIYAKPSEDNTKIQINSYPILDALQHTVPVSEITQMYVDDEILDNALTSILAGSDASQEAYDDKLNSVRGKITNRFRR